MKASLVKIILIEKKYAKSLSTQLKEENKINQSYRISSKEGSNNVYIPLKDEVSDEDCTTLLKKILKEEYENNRNYIQLVENNFLHLTKTPISSGKSGSEQVRALLKSDYNWTEEEVSEIPEKWIKYGDVLVLYNSSIPKGNSQHVLSAFNKSGVCPGLRCILIHRGPIEGELREPQVDNYTIGQSSETIHIENNIKYCFDVQKIMFSPGNGVERIRMGNLKISNDENDSKKEKIIDMFCGLGYFTIPFVKNNKKNIEKLVAIEKNPNSYHYLCKNIVLNKLQDIIFAVNEDNRIAVEELVGKTDRILMGYLPNTKDFIHRALQFANPHKCTFHYHHLAKKNSSETVAMNDFQECLKELNLEQMRTITILVSSRVQSYCPQLYHYCTDILITQKLS